MKFYWILSVVFYLYKYVLVYFCRCIYVSVGGKFIYCHCNMFYTFRKNDTFQHSFLCWAVHIWDAKRETLIVILLSISERGLCFLLTWQTNIFFILSISIEVLLFFMQFFSSYILKITVYAVVIMFFVKTLQCKCFFL